MQRHDIAVVGALGFLGRHVVRALEQNGFAVRGLDLGDALYDAAGAPVEALADADAIVFLASTINPKVAAEQPERVEQDLAMVRTFVESLHRAARPRLVVYPGSGGTVYDTTQEPPYHEGSVVAPASAYGAAKLQAERIVAEHAPRECSIAVARISNLYGPGQPAKAGQGVIAHWLDAAMRGDEVVMFGADDITRDFIYVEDAAAAIVRIIQTPSPPDVVNVAAGAPTSLGELARVVQSVAGDFKVRHESKREFDVLRNWLDIGRARAELGWKPQMSLAEGIQRTWDAMNEAAR